MINFRCIFTSTVALLCGATVFAQALWDAERLSHVRAHSDDAFYSKAISDIVRRADKEMDTIPYSVMTKASAPKSGDMHDYFSLARYYWPDPDTPDGLPYVRRDGESNPETLKYDRNSLGKMAGRVELMTLAWYFTSDEKYAAKAVEQLRVWFINKNTRMNPNARYAQVSRGHHGDEGRCYGLIDTYSFVQMLDALALLEDSKSFKKSDSKKIREWFKTYLDWFLTSQQGIDEYNGDNNHAVAYDVQAVAMALYVGDCATAERFVRTFPERRIFTQIRPDGGMPKELARTNAFGYSQFNLSHMIDIMIMGKKLGIDITRAESEDGRCFLKAMDFLVPYVGKDVTAWPYKQINGWEGKQKQICQDLYRAAVYLYPERTDYLDLYKKYYKKGRAGLFDILY